MTKIAILPIRNEKGGILYHAIAGNKQSEGKTAGEALDVLTQQLPEEETNTVVIIQSQRADNFFTTEQMKRLCELMEQWRISCENGGNLPKDQQSELEALVEAELKASGNRISKIADELKR
jgi:hypothetical protein